jgi:hypothetical protein
MSKPHRGRSIRDLYAHGRGECPVCKRNNVKVLYEQDSGEQKFKICKTCKAAVKHGKKSLPAAAKKEEAAPKETPAVVEKTEPAKTAAVTETETAAE